MQTGRGTGTAESAIGWPGPQATTKSGTPAMGETRITLAWGGQSGFIGARGVVVRLPTTGAAWQDVLQWTGRLLRTYGCRSPSPPSAVTVAVADGDGQ
jgi:hypothetical protein